MTVIYRNKSKKSADSKNREDVAVHAVNSVSASIALQNSFSALQNNASDSDSDSNGNLEQFEWKTMSSASELDVSDEITPVTDIDDDNAEESQDETYTDNTDTSYSSEESASSEEEIVVNEKRYQRVRQPWCRDGVPCAVTSIVFLLAFAYFMQFVFYMCGLVNDDCCSPASLLDCSKGRR
jgi:hypothetical protein